MRGARAAHPTSASRHRFHRGSSPRAGSVGRNTGSFSLAGATAAVTGTLPHAIHHIGLVAGGALLVRAWGQGLLATLGLVAMVPLLLRMRRRSGAWRKPALMLALFAAVFAVSTFVVGPALRDAGTAAPAASPPADPALHERHQE